LTLAIDPDQAPKGEPVDEAIAWQVSAAA